MRNFFRKIPFSPVALMGSTVGFLAVVYIGLIATVMGYATMTIEFSQSVRNGAAEVATLEEEYFAAVARIMATDYSAANYVVPVEKVFVGTKSVTALR